MNHHGGTYGGREKGIGKLIMKIVKTINVLIIFLYQEIHG